jgi:hypothetical protein
MITILTLQFGARDYFEVSGNLLREYARRHDYGFTISKGQTFLDSRDLRWSKVPAIINALESSARVLYMDADAVITNPSRSLEAMEDLLGDSAMLLGEDFQRWANTGIMYFTQRALPILKEWNRIPVRHPETANEWPVDELGFNRYILPKYESIIALPKRVDRTDSDFIHGSFFHHFANGTHDEKDARIKKFIANQ